MSRTPSDISSTRTFMSPPKAEPTPPKTRRQLKVSPKLVPWAAVVILLLVSVFLFQQYHDAKQKLQAKSSNVAAAQVSNTVASVRKLVVLPASETPTVATVQNVSKLQSQTFFKNAANGDKVLVYANEKEAILYRPRTNQIVIIAPVTLNAGGGTSLSNN